LSPTGQRMPLARDFFETFEALEIARNPWVLQEGLFTYLSLFLGVDPVRYLRSGIDIEELHSEISGHLYRVIDGEDEIERIAVHRAYSELIFLFAATINAIQNGPVSPAHQSLARHIAPHDVIITFNWDTLLDRALASQTAWSVDAGYGVGPLSVFRDGWAPPKEAAGKPVLLKLHGSTNWIVGYPVVENGKLMLTQDAPPETLRVYEAATQPYKCYAGRYMPGYQPFSYGYYPPNLDDPGRAAPEGRVIVRLRPVVPWKPEGTAGDEGLVSIPLIIPPVKEKTYDLYGALFHQLWDKARAALTEAAHVVVIGYSFPRTDHRSTKLFLDAFAARHSMPNVTIINPDPARIRDKFLVEFGVPEANLTIYPAPFTKDFPLTDALTP